MPSQTNSNENIKTSEDADNFILFSLKVDISKKNDTNQKVKKGV